MFQRTRFKIAVYVLLFVIALATLIWWQGYNRERGRDYERIGQMQVLSFLLADYFFRFNTYEISGCAVGAAISDCQGGDSRQLSGDKIVDPINRGSFRFVVKEISADNFRVDFALESGVGGLKAGNYFLTRDGISK